MPGGRRARAQALSQIPLWTFSLPTAAAAPLSSSFSFDSGLPDECPLSRLNLPAHYISSGISAIGGSDGMCVHVTERSGVDWLLTTRNRGCEVSEERRGG